MDEVFTTRGALPPGRLRELSARRDGPGIVRGAVHGGLIVVALAVAVSDGLPTGLRVIALLMAGVLFGLLFGPFHEAMHRTAFRSRALNELLYGFTSVAQLFTPTGYRAFHFAHHRHTHDPVLDPEIAPAPAILGAWPRSALVHLGLASGQHLVVLKLGLLLGLASGIPSLYDRFMPWLPREQRRRTGWEARGVLLLWAGIAGAAWAGSGIAQALLVVQLIGHAALSPLLMAEHHGLPSEGDALTRTRSIATIAPLRWFYWNMPYHAEHHGWPSVPFHALPALHAEVAAHLPHRDQGYIAVHLGALPT